MILRLYRELLIINMYLIMNGDKIKDSNGNVISEFTGAEYADVKNSTDELSKQIEATRDYLKKVYAVDATSLIPTDADMYAYAELLDTQG